MFLEPQKWAFKVPIAQYRHDNSCGEFCQRGQKVLKHGVAMDREGREDAKQWRKQKHGKYGVKDVEPIAVFAKEA
jgi:hypothetical protein